MAGMIARRRKATPNPVPREVQAGGAPLGIVVTTATFDRPTPCATRIAEAVAELTGQRVTVEDFGPDVRGPLSALNAFLAFTAFPHARVELTAYDGDAVLEHLRKTGLAGTPVARATMGANDAPGTQTVYVQTYLGAEPTLFFATALALEALGGRLAEPADEAMRREYGVRVSHAELNRRRRAASRRAGLALTGGCLAVSFAPLTWIALTFRLVAKLLWRAPRRRGRPAA